MRGALVRPCLAGRNAGNSARSASESAKTRRWALQGALMASPAACAGTASWLPCQGDGLASVKAARRADGPNASQQPACNAGAVHGSSSHSLTPPASLVRPHVVRHNGCSWYAERADVDSTRRAARSFRSLDRLRSPPRFELRGSSLLTAWRRASWLRARGGGLSAAGSVSAIRGHATRNHQRGASHGEYHGRRESVCRKRGTFSSATHVQPARSAASAHEGNQP